MIEIQNLARICNEDLILGALQNDRKHGYQLALEIEEQSAGIFRFKHGTLYPILHKLEKDRLIKGIWKKEGARRKVKYYSLTAAGRRQLAQDTADWQVFHRHLFDILGGFR
jgi:DNA-binding PadR family transcriptional regulator